MRYLIALLLSVSLFSQATPSRERTMPPGVFWVAIAAGADHHLMMDASFAFHRAGATAWGMEIGIVGLNDQDTNTRPLAPNETRETDWGGVQLGAWADWGRAYGAVGVERVTQSTTFNQITLTPNTNIPVTNSVTTDTAKFGGFVKVGYRFTKNFSIYGSYGTQSKAFVGLGFHF